MKTRAHEKRRERRPYACIYVVICCLLGSIIELQITLFRERERFAIRECLAHPYLSVGQRKDLRHWIQALAVLDASTNSITTQQ